MKTACARIISDETMDEFLYSVSNMKKSEALNILGLSGNPTEEEIKKAHRKKVIENHPDRFQDPTKKAAAEERTKLINEARDVLERGNWDPEFSSTSYNRPYGNPYGNPYRGGGYYRPTSGGQNQDNPFGFDPNFWVQWEQASRGNGTDSGQHTYDPFNNPFSAQQTTQSTAERAKAVAERDMRIGFGMLAVKLVACGLLALQGAWLGAMVVWSILSFIVAGSNRLGGNASGCLWLILLPLFMYFPTMIAILSYNQSPANVPVIVAVAIIFVWGLYYDVRDLREAVRRWRVTTGKKSPGEKRAGKRRARKEARAKKKAAKQK